MDHFARLGFEPRPWIDPEALKSKFLDLSAATHPDKSRAIDKSVAEAEFQQLNESYTVLRITRRRLLHLIELAGGAPQEQIQNVPQVALELFGEVAAATKRADAILKEKASASSPMLMVQLMERGLNELDALQRIQGSLRQRTEAIADSLRDLDTRWSFPPSATAMHAINEAAAALGFLDRWNAQLQERVGRLTF